jgi:hypothetical protein
MKLLKHTYFAFLLAVLLTAHSLQAQAAAGILRGQVTDPSGAAVTKASVILTPSTGSPLTTLSDASGMYEFKSLAVGQYTLTVVAQGFTLYENPNVAITDQTLRLNVALTIQVEEQKVQVSDTSPTVDVNPASNAGAIVISGKELEALPDDPDELQADLEALAGPSAGPNGGQMYIDGFTAGQLPPKSSIREIRINQNPFSSEYDKLGYGRIEIFTKPGTDKLHGQIFVSGNDSAFNSSNPFAGQEPGYYTTQLSGNIGGPLGKKASIFFNVERRNINDLSAINAQTLDESTLLPTAFVQAVPNPRRRTNIGPRFDYAISKNNTLTARYQYYRDTQNNDGIGQFTLPDQAYNSASTEHTLQISDTQVIGSKVVNETRFQFLRENDSQFAQKTLIPAVNVQGAFDSGGNSQGTIIDHQDHSELQNYTSVIHGNHILKFGARIRAIRDSEDTTSGLNGTFIFSSLANLQAVECLLAATPPTLCQTLPPGATPEQLSITQAASQGGTNAQVTYFDAGLYAQDDWRIRPNITLSAGLRFETQNNIHDHGDWAPRVGIAWGVGGRSGPPKLVLRGGFGIFYDRFQTEQLLQAELLNGFLQKKFVINNPTCFPGLANLGPISDLTACGSPSTTTLTAYQVSPRLRAPYTLQSAISAERQLTKSATLSVTYLNSRGFDQLLTLSCVQGLPPCLGATAPGVSRIYQFVSEGNFTQNQLIVNSNVKVGSKVQLFGYYTLNYANSDASGVSGFPSNSYDINQDYGRASFDTRHRLFFGGSIALPYLFRLSPFMIASSGSPFNITAPTDLNVDSVFNDRPALVSTATCPTATLQAQSLSVYCTPFGTFDAAGGARVLPINYGTGPAHFVLNLRLTKTFGIGPKAQKGATGPGAGPAGGGGGGGGGGHSHGPLFGGGGPGGGMSSNSDRRYNLILGVNVRNVFNKVNLANPGGILGSPFFGISNSLQGGPFSGSGANRRIDVQATFSF